MCRLASMYAHVLLLFVKIIVKKMIIIIINNDNNVDNGYKIYEATSTHARMNGCAYVRTYVCMNPLCMYRDMLLKISLLFINFYHTTSSPRVQQSHASKMTIH